MINNKFEIVETILRAAGGEKYLNNFKEHCVDLSYLKLLNEEDLTIIGVDDVDTRNNILRNCSNLQIRLQTRTDLIVDKEYVQTVLQQMLNQLKLHHANLACVILRNDTVVVNIKLLKVCRSLSSNLRRLENEINLLQQKLIPTTKAKRRRRIIFVAVTALLVGLGLKSILK